MAQSTQRSKVVDDIERKTGRKVVIDTSQAASVFANCLPQDQCPLFTLLPREVLDLIWAFATAPVDDKDNLYEKNAYYYRPGHAAKLKTDYNLLLTCRRIWLEAHNLPMLQAEHSFWYYRAAPDARSKEWMAALTPLNPKHFGTLHLFAQMYTIERLHSGDGDLKSYFLPSSHTLSKKSEDFQPSTFHVTIRHTDWWNWEIDEPLRFEYQWFQAMLDSPDLRRTEFLRLELETVDYKVSQLIPIVEYIRQMQSKEYRTHEVKEKPTTTKFVLTGEPHVSSWTGPTDLDGVSYVPYENKTALNYHIVTLTWRLQFPEYPKAHIQNLRQAPQCYTKSPARARGLLSRSRHESDNPEDDDAFTSDVPDDKFRFQPSPIGHSWYQWHRLTNARRRGNVLVEKSDYINEEVMIDSARDVLRDSTWQARIGEWYRRRQFWRSMQPIQEEHWRKRFKEQNSLLRLE